MISLKLDQTKHISKKNTHDSWFSEECLYNRIKQILLLIYLIDLDLQNIRKKYFKWKSSLLKKIVIHKYKYMMAGVADEAGKLEM